MLAKTLPQLAQDYTAAAHPMRRIVTPAARLPLRSDFPNYMLFEYYDFSKKDALALLKKINRAFMPFGTNLQSLRHITLAYPHKDPVTMPAHKNNAHDTALKFIDILAPLTPHLTWCMADSIVELRHLHRSVKQDVSHTLTARQEYALRPALQSTPLPWLEGAKGPHYTIMVDQCVEQGTTLMNMASMLQANDFTLIGASVIKNLASSKNLRQTRSNPPIIIRGDGPNGYVFPEHRQARPKQLGHVFARSILNHHSRIADPVKCLSGFDKALALHGLHHTTLTDGECAKIIYYFRYCDLDFISFLDELTLPDKRAVSGQQQTPLRP